MSARDWIARDYLAHQLVAFWRKCSGVEGLALTLTNLERYIATVETAKHRLFQFLDADVLPDNMIVAIGSDDAYALGVLSAGLHAVWVASNGGASVAGIEPRYSKSRCFDPFPFPDTNDLQKHRIRQIAERLDAHRKRVLAEHEHLTLTGLYNVLEKLRAGTAPADLDPPTAASSTMVSSASSTKTTTN